MDQSLSSFIMQTIETQLKVKDRTVSINLKKIHTHTAAVLKEVFLKICLPPIWNGVDPTSLCCWNDNVPWCLLGDHSLGTFCANFRNKASKGNITKGLNHNARLPQEHVLDLNMCLLKRDGNILTLEFNTLQDCLLTEEGMEQEVWLWNHETAIKKWLNPYVIPVLVDVVTAYLRSRFTFDELEVSLLTVWMQTSSL